MKRDRLHRSLVKTYTKLFAVSLAFLIGVGVAVGAYHIYRLDQAAAESKTRSFVCGIHQSALYDRAEQYHQKGGRWPTNVQELVEAHFLPEYSEVHVCPSAVGILARTDYQDSAFVDENHTGLVAYYALSPYRFQIERDKFTVICTFDKSHTR